MTVLKQYKWIFHLIVLLIVAALVGLGAYQSKYSLMCTTYQIHTDKLESSVKILQITDLHNSTFGEDNVALLDLVAEQAPDLILITGDLLNSDELQTKTATDLISNLHKIAPVYVSFGNHEVEYQESFGVDVAELYENAGAVVLEKQYVDIEVNDQQIRLGGIYGYCLPEKYLETNEADPEECAFLKNFQETENYTILMCHMPVCWLINDGLNEWEIDCIFSGHVHGGEVILPFVGGLYAPDFGWFPGKLQGVYESEGENNVLILSRGLGTTEAVPRFHNIPEVVVVDILP